MNVPGGVPPMRPDQALQPRSRAGTGPAPQNEFLIAQRVIVFGTGPARGIFVYSPVPGPGNLVESIAAAPGTDPYGNPYVAGFASYSASGYTQVVTNAIVFHLTGDVFDGSVTPTAAGGGPSGVPGVILASPSNFNAAGGNSQAVVAVVGESSGGTVGPYVFFGSNQTGSTPIEGVQVLVVGEVSFAAAGVAGGSLVSLGPTLTGNGASGFLLTPTSAATAATTALLEVQGEISSNTFLNLIAGSTPAGATSTVRLNCVNTNQLQTVNASGLAANASVSKVADVATHTVTGTGLNIITNTWSIPANDISVNGAVYELEAVGIGTQGSTAETLRFVSLFASSFAASITFPSGFAGVSAAFSWKATARIVCVSGAGGASASFTGEMTVIITPNATLTSAVATNLVTSASLSGIDTTSAENWYIECGWGATTGAPTITCENSWLKRVA